ncbi:MAG: triose-phosphate isomerase [Gaiellales bacterium]|nr:triose-phosphate isomerase [Gaiellales bacterium]
MPIQRKLIMAGNWKLFKTGPEGAAFVKELAACLGAVEGLDVVVAPPFTSLHQVAEACKGTAVTAAAQDVFWEEKGAFTGEVAPHMVRDAGAAWAIIGHSERRQYFGETDESVAKKARAVVDAGLAPIVCVGELENERESGLTEQVLKRQVTEGLSRMSAEEVAALAIAYEPVWAIGTGRTATPQVAQEACAYIRGLVAERFGSQVAERVRILYGGSVKADNASELMSQADIDGGLVGGASLEVESFAGIIEHSRP